MGRVPCRGPPGLPVPLGLLLVHRRLRGQREVRRSGARPARMVAVVAAVHHARQQHRADPPGRHGRREAVRDDHLRHPARLPPAGPGRRPRGRTVLRRDAGRNGPVRPPGQSRRTRPGRSHRAADHRRLRGQPERAPDGQGARVLRPGVGAAVRGRRGRRGERDRRRRARLPGRRHRRRGRGPRRARGLDHHANPDDPGRHARPLSRPGLLGPPARHRTGERPPDHRTRGPARPGGERAGQAVTQLARSPGRTG